MQILSWILMLVILYILATSKSKKDRFIRILILNIVISTHFESGYFISLGGFEIDYDQAISIITVLFGVLATNFKFKRSNIEIPIMFYISLLIGVVFLIVWPYEEKIVTGAANNYDSVIAGSTTMQYVSFDFGTISGLVSFFVFVVIVICSYSLLNSEDIKRVIVKTAFAYKMIFIYGIVEAVLVYMFHSTIQRKIINTIMGRGISTFSDLIVRENGYMLQGLTREGSHYMFALFVSIIVIFTASYLKNKKALPWIIIYILLSFLSFSLSSVLYLAGATIYYVLIVFRNDSSDAKNKLSKIGVFALVGTFIIIIALCVVASIGQNTNSYLLNRLSTALNSLVFLLKNSNIVLYYNNVLLESSMVRLYSVIETLRLLIHRPLFGFGIGIITCHGSTIMFLGDVGIIGLFLWYKMMINVKRIGDFNWIGFRLFSESVILYLMINILSSVYLVPYYRSVVLIFIFASVINFQDDKTGHRFHTYTRLG